MLSFYGVTFVLFRFRLYGLTEVAALRSIVFRPSICIRLDSHAQLPTTVYCTSSFVFVSLEMSLFPTIFVPLPLYFCREST